MSAGSPKSHRLASARSAALGASLALLGGLLVASSAAALVRSPLTGEWVESLPSAPQPLASARSARAPAGVTPGGLYCSDGANLWEVDKATGATTLAGAHGIPSAEFAIGALSFADDGTLYGVSLGTSAQLYTIDPATGAATPVGPLGLDFVVEGGLDLVCDAPRAVNDLDFLTGEMKAFTLDLGTGAATRVGPAVGETRDLNGLAFSDHDAALYAIDRITNTIGTVDFATGAYAAGAMVAVGGVPLNVGSVGGLAVDPADGTLFASFEGTSTLYTVDPTTGAATPVGSMGLDCWGLAFAPPPVPTPSPTPAPTPTPPAPLDHYLFYKAKTTKGTPKLPVFGPVTLADAFGSFDYDVQRMRLIGLPADKNGEGIHDEVTHFVEYKVRPHKGAPRVPKGKFAQVETQFGRQTLVTTRPDALLVPSNKGLTSAPPLPTEADHNRDHFLCYKVKRWPGTSPVQIKDQFEDRQYELKRITRICNPVAKSGDPKVVKGPLVGNPFPITPSTVRNPERLVCYRAKRATGQPKHQKRLGVFVNNQFGVQRLDTKVEFEFCVPTIEPVPPTPTPTPTPPAPTPCHTPSPTPPYGSASRAFLAPAPGLLG